MSNRRAPETYEEKMESARRAVSLIKDEALLIAYSDAADTALRDPDEAKREVANYTYHAAKDEIKSRLKNKKAHPLLAEAKSYLRQGAASVAINFARHAFSDYMASGREGLSIAWERAKAREISGVASVIPNLKRMVKRRTGIDMSK